MSLQGIFIGWEGWEEDICKEGKKKKKGSGGGTKGRARTHGANRAAESCFSSALEQNITEATEFTEPVSATPA